MIRQAVIDDAPRVVRMIERYYREAIETQNYPIKFDSALVVTWVFTALLGEDTVAFIADHGIIIGKFDYTWFGGDPMTEGSVFYVEPEYRNGFLAIALIRKFIEESKRRGAIAMFMPNFAGLHPERMDGMLDRLGFMNQGAIYVKVLGGYH